jgi:RNAse (barnase) inhibitor barstar
MKSDTYQVRIDGARMGTLRTFYTRIAKELRFPAHFGRNLDALFDCLCDLEGIEEAQSVVVTIQNSAKFLSKERPERREAALKVLRDATVASNRYDTRSFNVEML